MALALGTAAASAQTGNISTVVGNGTGGASGDGGPASAALLGTPIAVTAMPDGGYLIFQQSFSVVRRVSPTGIITTVAGDGTTGYGGDGGQATAAQLNIPSGGVMTPDGGYLIADTSNNRVRRVAPDGTITTAVGTGAATYGGDGGQATAAQINFPYDIALHPSDGSYLIADVDNNRIRRVAADGTITTVAGTGAAGFSGDGGPATAAGIVDPSGVAYTADGGYLIADTTNQRVRKVAPDGTITTVAGTGTAGFSGDGGPATAAQLNAPVRVAVAADGSYLIADRSNHRVRRVAADGTITTVAGTGTAGFSGDGGPATAAALNNPFGVAFSGGGDFLIADTTNNRVRYVDAAAPTPVLTGSTPASPANENAPKIRGTAASGTTVNLYTNAACSGAPAGTDTAANFPAPGIGVTVADDSTTTFFATATDMANNASACSASSVTYVEDSTPVLPPPVRGRTVNAIPERGKVLVKLPAGAGAKAHAAATGFVPLETIGRQIPVGATLDTTKGTVLLTAAANSSGKTQDGHFSRGLFNIGQGRKNALTTLSMTGGSLNSCSKLPRGGARKEAVAAKRKRRTLFSNVKGRFRTRGRNSSATVRGTAWTMTDTCSGTLTKVQKGSVEVRDFRLRRTRLVRAGHSYLAHAPLRKKKH
ncbi:MAG: hypothetical protein QOJ57_1098 [Thermoleophilaceae bacterium]|nr:hypothetical protein [Thermoleophilaceae bacterium]